MALPDSYTMKTGAITAYFDAILNAEAPDRFSQKFLESLGFQSSNDRLMIGILKDLGFLTADGTPKERYYQFLDKSFSQRVLAEGIKDAFAELFNVNKNAYKMNADEAYNKLRSLYRGQKKDSVVKLIAKTFVALCAYADFESALPRMESSDEIKPNRENGENAEQLPRKRDQEFSPHQRRSRALHLDSLQYNLNIVLPETRDQSVYDSIFKSLRDHLG